MLQLDKYNIIDYKLSAKEIEAHSLFDKESNKMLLCRFTEMKAFFSLLKSEGINLSQLSKRIVDRNEKYTTVHYQCPLPLGNPFFASVKMESEECGSC